jgi:hypothetical protein
MTTKSEVAMKAAQVIKDAGKGMSLNEITKALHYMAPNLKARVYFGLKALVSTGGMTYGEKRGKERLFTLTGKELIMPVRKIREKKVAKTVTATPEAK